MRVCVEVIQESSSDPPPGEEIKTKQTQNQ